MSLNKLYILFFLLFSYSQIYSQQIKIGNYTFPAGGEYQGEMLPRPLLFRRGDYRIGFSP